MLTSREHALKTFVEGRIAEIKADERYGYPPALVQINAPLALIQVDLEARLQAYEAVLELLMRVP